MRTKDEALEQRRRTEILEAAARCFVAKGVHQTTVRDICAASRLSAGALYHYFPGKADIVLALADVEYAELHALTSRIAEAPELLPALRGLISSLIERISDPNYGRLLLEITSEAARNPAVMERLMQQQQSLEQGMRELLRRGQKAGQLDKSLNPDAVILVFCALIDGLTMRAAVEPGFKTSRVEQTVLLTLERLLTRGNSS